MQATQGVSYAPNFQGANTAGYSPMQPIPSQNPYAGATAPMQPVPSQNPYAGATAPMQPVPSQNPYAGATAPMQPVPSQNPYAAPFPNQMMMLPGGPSSEKKKSCGCCCLIIVAVVIGLVVIGSLIMIPNLSKGGSEPAKKVAGSESAQFLRKVKSLGERMDQAGADLDNEIMRILNSQIETTTEQIQQSMTNLKRIYPQKEATDIAEIFFKKLTPETPGASQKQVASGQLLFGNVALPVLALVAKNDPRRLRVAWSPLKPGETREIETKKRCSDTDHEVTKVCEIYLTKLVSELEAAAVTKNKLAASLVTLLSSGQISEDVQDQVLTASESSPPTAFSWPKGWNFDEVSFPGARS